jgi:alcohol dehydrogenase (cytochrome c)
MTTADYVDAGEAINQGLLNYKTPGADVAPPVVAEVTYDRILNAREEPQNWLTYYGAYNGQRFSPLDQINT